MSILDHADAVVDERELRPPELSHWALFVRFLKFGFMAFGGPVAQKPTGPPLTVLSSLKSPGGLPYWRPRRGGSQFPNDRRCQRAIALSHAREAVGQRKDSERHEAKLEETDEQSPVA